MLAFDERINNIESGLVYLFNSFKESNTEDELDVTLEKIFTEAFSDIEQRLLDIELLLQQEDFLLNYINESVSD